tara:strand:+ start:193 stop:393 length:201 start_codon:yes stop_codon:yes gene_type:complete
VVINNDIYSSDNSANIGGGHLFLYNKTSIKHSKASGMHFSNYRFMLVSGDFFDGYLNFTRGSKFLH